MWTPQWLSSPRGNKLRRHSSFSCSSFKDVQSLCREDEGPGAKLLPRSPSIFHRVRISTAVLRGIIFAPGPAISPPPPPPKNKNISPSVILYFTSLRVVRRTYEDCRAVRFILRGLRVHVDERDLSMDAGFLEELQRITGTKKPGLPCVVIGGRVIGGGADQVRQLHESGELKRLVGGCRAGGSTCEGCGGFCYVVCEECSGSHKIYSDKTEGFRSCNACNVSGLIRCRYCSIDPNYY